MCAHACTHAHPHSCIILRSTCIHTWPTDPSFLLRHRRKLALRKEAPLHKNFTHISKRGHLFELKLEPNPEYDALKGSATRVDTGYAPLFICPITKRPTNGVTPFVALRPCGHVISEQCVKAIKPTEQGHVCIVCATPYNKVTPRALLLPF